MKIASRIVSKAIGFLKSEDGPTTVEYSIMLGLIVVTCVVAIQTIGTDTNSVFVDFADDIDSARSLGG